jgi:hypothetical protein
VGTRKVRNKGREEIKKKRKKKKAHVGCFSYKLYRLFLSPHSLSVTTVTLGSRLFFNSAANKLEQEEIQFFAPSSLGQCKPRSMSDKNRKK